MLRAAWLGQELLATFEHSIGEVTLVPGESGQFQIFANGTVTWDRTTDGGSALMITKGTPTNPPQPKLPLPQ